MPNQKAGYIIITDPDAPVRESDSFVCCHCNAIIAVHIGSGKQRGFCRLCMQPTCGKERCMDCVPFERRIEEMESRDRFRRTLERF